MNVRMSQYTTRFTVVADNQEAAINKAIDRAKECDESQSNKIVTIHCLNEYTVEQIVNNRIN